MSKQQVSIFMGGTGANTASDARTNLGVVALSGDTMTGNLNVAATLITQNVIPNANITYDLGSSEARFKDLWLSNSTIYLGEASISAQGGNVSFGNAEIQLSNVTTKLNVTNDLFVSGNVGIGTTSPAEAIEISRTTDPKIRFVDVGNLDAKIGIMGSTALGFEVNGNEYARIDNNGHFGLGVTPSAWGNNSFTAFQVGDTGSFASNDFGGSNIQILLGNNVYYDGTAFKYIKTNVASMYRIVGNEHSWSYAESGTADANASFTQAMTLNASGNLGVGTTSPASKLDVVGNARFYSDGGNVDVQINRQNNSIYNPTLTMWSAYSATNVSQRWSIDVNGPSYSFLGSLRFLDSNASNTERARITAGGFFKASNNGSYTANGNQHEFNQNTFQEYVCWFNQGHASQPYGVYINYTGAAPNGTSNEFLRCLDTSATRASIRSNGGLANYQSNNADLSDERTKKEITPAPSYWNKIGALEIVTYKYNDQTHDDVNVGVIAQQVESVEPVWVDSDGFGETPEGEEPLKTVYTKDITFAAIKALQEAMARIEQLEAKVASLEAK